MIVLGRPTEERIAAFLDKATTAPFLYDDVGATRDGPPPPGYHHGRYQRDLGQGDDRFQAAKENLRHWKAHAAAGVTIYPTDAPIEAGTVVVGTLRLGPATVMFPCRIVYVIDDRDRFGFAYGTLPGHPESGEEKFLIERGPDDTVTFTIEVFSKPAELLTRLGGPVPRALQARATRQYLTGI